MKVPAAICLRCGWAGTNLDELDTHQCQPTRRPHPREVACPHCWSQATHPCRSWAGRPVDYHTARWHAADTVPPDD